MKKLSVIKNENTLSWIGLAVSLTTLHYGLGFLIGSGEAIYVSGSIGILYALSTAIGVFSLLLISKFYLKKKQPIWTLMGEKYGSHVSESIALLSSIWMIGVVASQVLGGASVLHTFGVQNQLSILIMAIAITILSLVNLKNLVAFFSMMLVLSSLSVVLILSIFGFNWIWFSISGAANEILTLSIFDITGVLIPTVLVTFIGMDFHQFLVKAKNKNEANYGIVASGVLLIAISIVLLSLVNASIGQHMLSGTIDPKQTMSLILSRFGNGMSEGVGFLLLLPIILVAIGSGSGVNRIVNTSMTSSKVLPSFLIKKPNVFVFVFAFVVLIALTGDSIISLIVSFYAIYVGAVFLPFIAFLLDIKYDLKLTKSSVTLSILASAISMLTVFALSYLPNSFIGENKTTYMLLVGFLISFLILGINNRSRFRLLFSLFKNSYLQSHLFNKRRIHAIIKE